MNDTFTAAISWKSKPDIVAVFRNGREIKMTVSSLPLLKTDSEISMVYSADTGEIIFTNE